MTPGAVVETVALPTEAATIHSENDRDYPRLAEMTHWRGALQKMRVEESRPARYWLRDGNVDAGERSDDLALNDLLGHELSLHFTGEISCTFCGRAVRKTYGQGFCFPCFRDRPEADTCLVKPELCHFFDEDNPCRDPAWGQQHCFQPHLLYASLTSGVKVGITRRPHVPTRWLDQGAVAVVPLAELPSRKEVGEIEHRLATSGVNDRTHWMVMLREERPDIDLEEVAEEILATLESWGVVVLPEPERRLRSFTYPVATYPTKVKALNLDKTPETSGRLLGIKGQYLILETGVLNVRKFTGYHVEVEAGEAVSPDDEFTLIG